MGLHRSALRWLETNPEEKEEKEANEKEYHRLRSVSSSMYIEEGEDHTTLSFLPMSKTGSSFLPFFFLVKPLFD